MELYGLDAGFLGVHRRLPAYGALPLDDRAFLFDGEDVAGIALLWPKLLDVGEEFLKDRINLDGVYSLRAGEDDAFSSFLTQAQMTEASGVALLTYGRWESFKFEPSVIQIKSIAYFLEVPVGRVIGDVAFEPYSDAEYWLNATIRIFLLLCYNLSVKRDGRHKKTTQ